MSLSQLDLPDDATEDDVKSRFRELARAAHPDTGGSAEKFQELKDLRDAALREVRMGVSVANARSQLRALREAARGIQCPRCDGTGASMTRQVGFRAYRAVCRLCHGKGKIQ